LDCCVETSYQFSKLSFSSSKVGLSLFSFFLLYLTPVYSHRYSEKNRRTNDLSISNKEKTTLQRIFTILSNEKEVIQSTSSLSLFQVYSEEVLPLLQATTTTGNGKQNKTKSITYDKSSSDLCPICHKEIVFNWIQPESAMCHACSINFGRCCFSLEITDTGMDEDEDIDKEKVILICVLCSTQAIYNENNNNQNNGDKQGNQERTEHDNNNHHFTCPYCMLIMKKL
jgi:hypothetical protein